MSSGPDVSLEEARGNNRALIREFLEKMMVSTGAGGVSEEFIHKGETILRDNVLPLNRRYDLLRETAGWEKAINGWVLSFLIWSDLTSGRVEGAGGISDFLESRLEGTNLPVVISRERIGGASREEVESLRSYIDQANQELKERQKEIDRLKDENRQLKEQEEKRKQQEPEWVNEIIQANQAVANASDASARAKALLELADLLSRHAVSYYQRAHEEAMKTEDGRLVARTALRLAQSPELSHEDRAFFAEVALHLAGRLELDEEEDQAKVEIFAAQSYFGLEKSNKIHRRFHRELEDYEHFFKERSSRE